MRRQPARAREGGATIARVTSLIYHDKGGIALTSHLRRKYAYGKSMPAYRRKHRRAPKRQSLLVRPAFIRHRRALGAEPLTTAGIFALKTLGYIAGALGALPTLSPQSSASKRAVALFIGDRGRIRSVEFREGGRAFRARVSEDNLWGAVKDNLVLAEYERAGIRLEDARRVVIDAGAHVGIFSLLASAHARAVVSLEPHPVNFAQLAANMAANKVESVDARQSALWSQQGKVDLVEGPHSGAGSVLGGEGRTITVEAETLDSIVAETGPVDLLKLDIEGAEFEVLESALDETLRQISAVVAELHLEGQRERLAPTVDRLRRSGFAVVVSPPPSARWYESMRALIQKRRRLRAEARLRLAVVVLYSLAAVLRLVWKPTAADDELLFLYATRGGSH
jgi:FkbM family methyltransferase